MAELNEAVDRVMAAAKQEGMNAAQALMFGAAMASITAPEENAVAAFIEARRQLIERGAHLRVVDR